jgi:hypothetical protein
VRRQGGRSRRGSGEGEGETVVQSLFVLVGTSLVTYWARALERNEERE